MYRSDMIPTKSLKDIKTIIVHAACPDGLASALILQDSFNQVSPDHKPPIKFIQYDTIEQKELVAEPGLLFADFSPHVSRIKEFVDVGAIVLDHHRTAKPVVEQFGEFGIFGDEFAEPGVCGAVLAYRHVFCPLLAERGSNLTERYQQFVEHFAYLAGVRDTWQRQSSDWDASCIQAAALFFADPDEALSEGLPKLYRDWEHKYLWAGRVTHERHLKKAERSAKKGHRFISSHDARVVMFQGTHYASDTAEMLEEAADLVVGFDVFFDGGEPKYLYSTRSHTTFDCVALCKFYGGGGHTRAAGFTISAPQGNPYAIFEQLLNAFEAK